MDMTKWCDSCARLMLVWRYTRRTPRRLSIWPPSKGTCTLCRAFARRAHRRVPRARRARSSRGKSFRRCQPSQRPFQMPEHNRQRLLHVCRTLCPHAGAPLTKLATDNAPTTDAGDTEERITAVWNPSPVLRAHLCPHLGRIDRMGAGLRTTLSCPLRSQSSVHDMLFLKCFRFWCRSHPTGGVLVEAPDLQWYHQMWRICF